MTEVPAPREVLQGKSHMEVNPLGARPELTLGGHKLLVKVTRGDEAEGSTHPCTPIFGPDRQDLFGAKQHGKARKELWNQVTNTPTLVELTHDINEGRYPEGMHVKQKFELQDGLFRLTTVHTNNNETEDLPVNFAEHFYWDAPQGWEGVKVNGHDVTQLVKDDAGMDWKDVNIIQIPGKPAIKVEQQGLPHMWGWAGGKEDETGKVVEFDKHYVALEACEGREERFGTEESKLKPGESRETVVTISLATDEEVAKYATAA